MQRIAIIAALGAKNRAIGKGGTLLWHLPEDMKRFKALTTGHPVIMGRKTWESLPERARPLPNRTNIVVSRDASYQAPGAEVAASLEGALAAAASAPGAEELFIIGGSELYRQALPLATNLYLTLVESDEEGDVFFPPYETEFPKITSDQSGESNGINYRWLDLERN